MKSVAAMAEAFDNDHLSRRNFERLAQHIFKLAGIKMPPSKRTLLEGRLRRRLRVTGFTTLDEYCDYLFDHGGLDEEGVHLINVVTTNKTDFFREPNHFAFMKDVALPELHAVKRDIRVWSAACSTGAEPYTIAMILEEFARLQRDVSYSILATDLSTDVLATAHRAIYPIEMISPVPVDLARKYVMQPNDPATQQVRIHPSLRAKVAFARMNLMDATYSVGAPMSIIFCRNVLIYFDKKTQGDVLRRLCDSLTHGGYLFIGHSESVAGIDLPVRQVSNTVFQKVRQ